MRLLAPTLLISAAAGALAAACGVDAGIPETPDAGAVGDDATMGADVDTTNGDASGGDADAASVDAPAEGQVITVEASDANVCLASDTPSDAAGVFVVPSGANNASCGTRAAPCATAQYGIGRATTLGRSLVYLAPGTYTESITLVAGVGLEGGWAVSGATWTRDCTASTTVLQAPATANVAVLAADLHGAASLRLLTVKTKAQAAAGESLYGVLARGATTALTLDEVTVVAAAGGAGSTGATGGAGSPATGTCAPAGNGAVGAPAGAIGTGAPAGTFTASGFVPGNGVTQGGPGARGQNGTAGGAPQCLGCVSCGIVVVCGATATGTQTCGTNGLSGCGGGGGGGGQPGTGGGGSFALYAWDADVTVIGGSLQAGDGGSGGAGGPGGGGGASSGGAAGSIGPSCTVSCAAVTCAAVAGQGAGGSTGGAGGTGANGGAGGGGAGGDSYAIVQGGAATVATTASTTLTHGNAGPSNGNGSPGAAGARYP